MPQPTITFKIYSPYYTNYGPGEGPDAPGFTSKRSYFDIYVASESFVPGPYYAGQWFDAWCLNPLLSIGVPNASQTSPIYSATLYSSYELALLPASLTAPNVPAVFQQNLDLVNWVLNQDYATRGDLTFSDGVNYGEVQAAMWRILGFEDSSWNYPASVLWLTKDGLLTDGDINIIANDAIAHGNDFIPDAGQTLGVILDSSLNSVSKQPIIIETKAAALGDRVWHDTNANGIQDRGEIGIAGTVVKLVRDLNSDSDFDDLNEVLATTTTDVNGNYAFKGLTLW